MVQQVGQLEAGDGPARYAWLTPDRLGQVRAILLGITLLIGMAVWIFHTLGSSREPAPIFITKLRGVGVLTWVYALVQMLDMRFYNSRFARRRRESARIPDSLHGWLFGQMVAWFGILYYGLTEDLRWYIAGLFILAISFVAFPIRKSE